MSVSTKHRRVSGVEPGLVPPLRSYSVDWFFSGRGRRAMRSATSVSSHADADLGGGGGGASAPPIAATPGAAHSPVRGRGRARLRTSRAHRAVEAELPPGHGWMANARVVMNCVELDDGFRLVSTRDAADRAHRQRVTVKDERGGLTELYVGAADRRGRPARNVIATPRRYDRSQITSRGVAFDSAFDGLYLAQLRLAGVPGVGVQAQVTVAEARNRSLAWLDSIAPRLSRSLICGGGEGRRRPSTL